MQILVTGVGLALIVVGLYFALGGHAKEASGGGFRQASIEGPAWLVLVAIGVGLVVLGAVRDFNTRDDDTAEDDSTASPVAPTDPTASPVPPTDPTASPVAPTDPTASPVAPTDPTATPVAPTDPTATPVPPTDPTAAPVPPTDPTATPVPPKLLAAGPDEIAGRVTYRGDPVAGIPVALAAGTECDRSRIQASVFTDDVGWYSFGALVPGDYIAFFNGWNDSAVPLEPYGGSCSWDLDKTGGQGLTLDWSLRRTDLQIISPAGSASPGSVAIQWLPYPDAVRYSIVINQRLPSFESIEFGAETGAETTDTSFTSDIGLGAGTYWVIVWAITQSGEQIANGQIEFTVG